MRARSRPEVASVSEARSLLGLTGPVDGPALTAAFRAAIKAARPDQRGGDEARFRKIIAAWRILQTEGHRLALAAPVAPPPSCPVVGISPLEALSGGHTVITVEGRRIRIRLPAGLRTGEHLRLKGAASDGSDLYLPVLVRSGDGLRVLGDDLYMTWPTPLRALSDGGRIEIETHAGPHSAWLIAGGATRRLRLKGLGLPARGQRPQGHLFVTLQPAADAPSAADDLLLRFGRVWVPDRLAA